MSTPATPIVRLLILLSLFCSPLFAQLDTTVEGHDARIGVLAGHHLIRAEFITVDGPNETVAISWRHFVRETADRDAKNLLPPEEVAVTNVASSMDSVTQRRTLAIECVLAYWQVSLHLFHKPNLADDPILHACRDELDAFYLNLVDWRTGKGKILVGQPACERPLHPSGAVTPERPPADKGETEALADVLTNTSKLTLSPQATDYPWSHADYARHTFESFAEIPEANARIDTNDINYALLHAAIFYETNRRRVEQELPRLSHSQALEAVATEHSNDMVDLNFFSHNSPVKGKETLSRRLNLAGAAHGVGAENIAITFGLDYEPGRPVYTPEQNGGYFSYRLHGAPLQMHTYVTLARQALVEWMGSPGHRRNILNSDLKFLGVGAAHFLNPGFHNISQFKLTQLFSSLPGRELMSVRTDDTGKSQ